MNVPDVYSKPEADALLANKVNISTQWYDFSLMNGFKVWNEQKAQFCKVSSLVSLRGVINHESGVMPLFDIIGVLPKGFRPTTTTYVLLSTSGGGGGGYVRLNIPPDGQLSFHYTNNQTSLNSNADFHVTFAI